MSLTNLQIHRVPGAAGYVVRGASNRRPRAFETMVQALEYARDLGVQSVTVYDAAGHPIMEAGARK